MKIDKPIFIVGSGRSGTTILYNLISIHPSVCWFSNYSDKYANVYLVPALHRILDLPWLGNSFKQKILHKKELVVKPREGDNIIHHHCGFKHSTKSTEKDLDLHVEKQFKDYIKRHLFLTGKSRFLHKATANTQRLRLINAMFKDAFFIHLIRDGRAVANSLLKINWWKDTVIWWLGEKVSDLEKNDKEPIELCALHWKKIVEEIRINRNILGNRYIEVRYEDLIKDVKKEITTLLHFCELSQSPSYFKLLPKTLPNMNRKWVNDLNHNQKSAIDSTIKPFLTELGYS